MAISPSRTPWANRQVGLRKYVAEVDGLRLPHRDLRFDLKTIIVEAESGASE